MSLPSNPSHGAQASLGGNDFIYDSGSNAWLLSRTSNDKTFYLEINAEINERLDSDLAYLRATANSSGFPVGAIVTFATKSMAPGFLLADGSVFNTAEFPDLYAYLDSEVLPDFSNRTHGYKAYDYGTYTSINPGEDFYFGIATYNGAGLTTDEDVLVALVQQKTGRLDSDIFALQDRVTELEGDLAQAVADRVFTDNTLSARLDAHDSDINLRGRFYVQSSTPSGGPNSGWVNTNTMRLHIWDETASVWTEVVTI